MKNVLAALCVVSLASAAAIAQQAAPAAEKPAAPATQEAVAAPAPEAAPAPAAVEIKAEKAVVATEIKDKEPVGENTVFSGVESVYFWNKITASATPAKIKHVYYLNDKMVNTIELEIKGSPYRTWTKKTVLPGKWKVELTDEAGTVISTVEFTVEAAAAAAPAPEAAAPAAAPAAEKPAAPAAAPSGK